MKIVEIKKIFRIILSIPKTIYFNFKCLDFKSAIRLPVLVAYDTVIKELPDKGNLKIESLAFGNIKIGLDKGSFNMGLKSYISIKGKVSIGRNCNMASGIKLISSQNSIIKLGDNFYCNANCIINANKNITIGKNCLLGWGVYILDSDGHEILQNNKLVNKAKKISVGDNVWIAAEAKILKGTIISPMTIIGLGSVLSSQYNESNIVIAGNPSKKVKENIFWRK